MELPELVEKKAKSKKEKVKRRIFISEHFFYFIIVMPLHQEQLTVVDKM